MLSKIKRLALLLSKKGIKWTYNYIHFTTFYMTKNPFLVKLLQYLEPYPQYVEIEPTTRCNLRCIMCEHTYWDSPNRDMSFEDFKQIVDQFPRLKWIGLTGIGENFLNKDFLKMVEYVKSKGVYVELFDSFYYMNEENSKALIDLGVDKLIASIDSATKKIYEEIRVGSDFNRVINNVKNFIRLKQEKRKHFPELEFHYIVSKKNFHEMAQYIDLVRSLTENPNDRKVFFTRMLHDYEEIKDLFVEIPEKVVREIENFAKTKGVEVLWNYNIPSIKPPINRCVVWYMPFIFVTGHVIPCCSGNEANRRDFQEETSLGNVFKKSFKEIWNGKNTKSLGEKFRMGKCLLPA